MKISEIMTSDAISVDEEMPISEVAEIISGKQIHAVPVVSKENKVLGIITETDFFTKDSSNVVYMPSLIDFVQKGKLEFGEDEKEAMNAVLHAKAKDIMTPKCENVSPDMSVEDFIKMIKEKSFNSYPVTDENGFLLGIMTIADVIKLL